MGDEPLVVKRMVAPGVVVVSTRLNGRSYQPRATLKCTAATAPVKVLALLGPPGVCCAKYRTLSPAPMPQEMSFRCSGYAGA